MQHRVDVLWIVLNCFLTALLLAGTGTLSARAQEAAPDTTARASGDAPTVYLDCEGCDERYIRRQITFVNYVRDRMQADVHVLGTLRSTGGGGRRYVLEFIGQKEYSESRFNLTYTTEATDTDVEIEEGLVSTLEIGLAPFAHASASGSQLDVTYEGGPESEEPRSQQVDDPWNHWVFEVDLGGGLEDEQSQSEYSLDIGLEADRVTALWRVRNELEVEYDQNVFERDDETIKSLSRNTEFETSSVRSISEHWSIGAFGDVNSSTFQNMALGLTLTPAIEYNVFPYQVADRKELTIAYRIGPRRLDYREETIFGRTEQIVGEQSLDVSLDLQQRWGSMYVGVEGSHYLHDFQKNSVEFNSYMSLRLIEGLAFQVGLSADLIHDQLHIPRGDASLEELLLRRRDLQTTYQYEVDVGFSYTFGSIYNNVVNTRL
jgi:hypothetical protein